MPRNNYSKGCVLCFETSNWKQKKWKQFQERMDVSKPQLGSFITRQGIVLA